MVFSRARSVANDLVNELRLNPADQLVESDGVSAGALRAGLPAIGGAPESQN